MDKHWGMNIINDAANNVLITPAYLLVRPTMQAADLDKQKHIQHLSCLAVS